MLKARFIYFPIFQARDSNRVTFARVSSKLRRLPLFREWPLAPTIIFGSVTPPAWRIWRRAWSVSNAFARASKTPTPSFLCFRVLVRLAIRVKAELNEFFTHGQARHPYPARGFGLVAVSQFDRPAEQLSFTGLEQAAVGIVQFAALGGA